jgi:aminoglycoside phosphotransferase
MTEGSGTERAAGAHLPWSETPERIREWASAVVGSAVVGVREATGGFSPGCCTVLRFDNGRAAFVKAVGEELNPVSPRFHRREAAMAASLPRLPQLPVLIDSYDDGDWVALMFEAIDGSMPAHPWQQKELDTVIEAMASLHEALTPCPVAEALPTSVRAEEVLTGWRTLAEMPALPDGLDPWSRRHLGRLVEAEVASLTAVDEGDTLVHGDIRADNVLLAGGVAVFVDWPHASRGTPLWDVLAMAPSVHLEGGPEPEAVLAKYRLANRLDPDATTAVIAAIGGFLTQRALLPPEPGLPTLRAFQDAQGRVTRDWVRTRTGWD